MRLLTPTALSEAQQKAIDFIYERDHSLLMLPVGFGKTVVALSAVSELLRAKAVKRVLIVAPLKVCQLTWAGEPSAWTHLSDLNVGLCLGNESNRLAILGDPSLNVVIVNYENLSWLLNNSPASYFDGLVLDEITKLKAVGGATFKSLRKRLKQFTWRVGMTGTLVEEGLEFLYGQCLLIDSGATFGKSKDRFLNAYFYPTDYNRYNWAPKPGSMKLLVEKISPFTFISDDSGRNNKLLIDYEFVSLDRPSRKIYKKMQTDMLVDIMAENSTVVTAANAAVMTGKLQQVCAGFLYHDGGIDSGVEPLHDNKLTAVRRFVACAGGPVVVVYWFKHELETLRQLFSGIDKTFAVLGEAPDKSLSAWNAGQLDVLLVHPRSCGHGLNLQYGGCRMIFTGPIWSRDSYDQVIGRLNRRGQIHDVHVCVVITRDSVEDKVMIPRLTGKKNAADNFRQHLMDS